MSEEWILYGTLGCHLCDEAAQVLKELKLKSRQIDISDEQSLMKQFELRIPVLAHAQHPERQLDWPFSPAQVELWIKQFE